MKMFKKDLQIVIVGFMFVARVALGCMFLYSALPKIRQPYDFLSNVYNYQLVGPKLGLLIAMALPWMEFFVGICLLGGIFVGGALLACVAMSVMFTFVIGWSMWQGLDISCGCFGAGTERISYVTLIRAIGIGLVAVIGFWLHVTGDKVVLLRDPGIACLTRPDPV